MTDTPIDIDVALVTRLVAAQFPQFVDLPVRPVDLSGWDNRTFRLGDRMSVRLPSAAGYVAQVRKEQHWLPHLAPLLPLPIPAPVAMGVPTDDYPWPWSIYGWLDGVPAATGSIADLTEFATDLAHFLAALYRIDASDGPLAGDHNFWRGGPLTVYDAETCDAIVELGDEIDAEAATEVWEAALAATWHGTPVWVHGDVAVGNLLIDHGRLSAVIDFGCMGVGDPACDTTIGWTLFTGASRAAFRAALPLDRATYARGRGWTIWKALITLPDHLRTNPTVAANTRRVIDEVIADHQAAS